VLPVLADAVADNLETAVVTLAGPENAVLGPRATHTFTILDSGTSVGFELSASGGSEGSSPAALDVVLNAPTTWPVTVSYRDFFARVHFTWSCGIGAGVTTAVLIARLTGVT
jgi:hypothetical protein